MRNARGRGPSAANSRRTARLHPRARRQRSVAFHDRGSVYTDHRRCKVETRRRNQVARFGRGVRIDREQRVAVLAPSPAVLAHGAQVQCPLSLSRNIVKSTYENDSSAPPAGPSSPNVGNALVYTPYRVTGPASPGCPHVSRCGRRACRPRIRPGSLAPAD